MEPVSPECPCAVVQGLSDYGRCAFGSGLGRFSHREPWTRALYLPALAAGWRTLRNVARRRLPAPCGQETRNRSIDMPPFLRRVAAALFGACVAPVATPATYTVTTSADSGAGSLRAAIEAAN